MRVGAHWWNHDWKPALHRTVFTNAVPRVSTKLLLFKQQQQRLFFADVMGQKTRVNSLLKGVVNETNP